MAAASKRRRACTAAKPRATISRSLSLSVDLIGEGPTAVVRQLQQILRQAESLARRQPGVIAHRGRPDEIKVLPLDERIGQLLIQPRLEHGGAPAVNRTIPQQRDTEAQPGFTGPLRSILVVIRQRASACQPVAAKNRAAPPAGELLETSVHRGRIIKAAGVAEDAGKDIEVERRAGALETA